MQIVNELNETLLQQDFLDANAPEKQLQHFQAIAQMYARIENAIAVLSDLQSNKSYIYNGKLAKEVGLDDGDQKMDEIESIWEEKIFEKIHPDDLLSKHILELQFFQMLKKVPQTERCDYFTSSKIRMQNNTGKYIAIRHRMFYIANFSNGSVWLALCLYNAADDFANDEIFSGNIVNSANGQIITHNTQSETPIISERELEILRLIRKGKISKEIAQLLSISINTVNRHRQNILEKLRVDNSFEACRIIEKMGLI